MRRGEGMASFHWLDACSLFRPGRWLKSLSVLSTLGKLFRFPCWALSPCPAITGIPWDSPKLPGHNASPALLDLRSPKHLQNHLTRPIIDCIPRFFFFFFCKIWHTCSSQSARSSHLQQEYRLILKQLPF